MKTPDVFYTVHRDLRGLTVDYPYRHRTQAETERYASDMRRFCRGGEFRIEAHTEPRKTTFRF